MMRTIQDHLASLISFVNPKYKAHNNKPPIAADPCQLILKIKIGAIKKKIDPIKEYKSEFVNFFKILKEKNNWKKKHKKYQNEKYWKLPGINDLINLKKKAKIGIESVYTIELAISSP